MDFDAPEYDYGSESDGLQSACSNDLDEQSGTLALLEYARFHHLSEDYTTVNPLVADVLCLSAPDPLYSAEFEDDHCYTPDITSDEKLSLDKGGTMFLKCALGAATGDSELCTEPVRRSKMYYTEEPLLSSDARLDYKIFTHTPHIILAVDSATLYKSSELNDVTKLLVWLEPAEIESNMENALAEKVQLTPDDISFLQKAFNARYPAYHYDPSSTQRRVKLWASYIHALHYRPKLI
ncbi:hypothetical protein AAFC00_006904 [Neodothiora populina]|uniref:Uncharacterized protein n=1 Tax=Neodothiora populina TaxID=2781224 RepID=A0ABR3PBS1_9PEZI